ncbi:DUF411 domain-containing protein [Methylosoma difficile]
MKNLKSLIVSGVLLVQGVVYAQTPETSQSVSATVYRSPTCGCCAKWVEHLKANHFLVEDHVVEDMPLIKNKYHVPDKLASCHTAIINGYVVEGHVPASAISKMLKDKPAIAGIAVPGMPMGTPGMEMGGKKDDYQVMGFDSNQHIDVFSGK